jgi:hypothetical protein
MEFIALVLIAAVFVLIFGSIIVGGGTRETRGPQQMELVIRQRLKDKRWVTFEELLAVGSRRELMSALPALLDGGYCVTEPAYKDARPSNWPGTDVCECQRFAAVRKQPHLFQFKLGRYA